MSCQYFPTAVGDSAESLGHPPAAGLIIIRSSGNESFKACAEESTAPHFAENSSSGGLDAWSPTAE